MCAPSMPFPSEPSTRLSRVAPHDACLNLDVGHAVLGEHALFLCDKQRRGIGERDEAEQRFCHFGAGGLRDGSAEGELRIDRAEQRGGSCAALRIERRLTPWWPLLPFLIVIVVVVLVVFDAPVDAPSYRFPSSSVTSPSKQKAAARSATCASPGQRHCCRSVVGLERHVWRLPLV